MMEIYLHAVASKKRRDTAAIAEFRSNHYSPGEKNPIIKSHVFGQHDIGLVQFKALKWALDKATAYEDQTIDIHVSWPIFAGKDDPGLELTRRQLREIMKTLGATIKLNSRLHERKHLKMEHKARLLLKDRSPLKPSNRNPEYAEENPYDFSKTSFSTNSKKNRAFSR